MSSPLESNRPEALKTLAQLQIDRLKREEEEEQWISGEELYTEGSSDEDDNAVRIKKREGRARKHRRATPGRDMKRKQGHQKSVSPQPPSSSLENVNKSGINPPELKLAEGGAVEEHIEISWRPKRGSIKLPNLTSDGRELLASSDVASH